MINNQKSKELFLWIISFLICWIIFIIGYLGYLYHFKEVRITPISNIQNNYADFLIKQHDHFLDSIIEFEAITKTTDRVYTQEEKDIITALLVEQNDILKKLQQFPPDANNNDYYQIYQDSLKIISFYIQGEIMKSEYIYNYKEKYLPEEKLSGNIVGIETYTIGHQLCELMGNMMLNNYIYINEVRNTNIESKFNILPMELLEKENTITKEKEVSIRKDLETVNDGLELIDNQLKEEIKTE